MFHFGILNVSIPVSSAVSSLPCLPETQWQIAGDQHDVVVGAISPSSAAHRGLHPDATIPARCDTRWAPGQPWPWGCRGNVQTTADFCGRGTIIQSHCGHIGLVSWLPITLGLPWECSDNCRLLWKRYHNPVSLRPYWSCFLTANHKLHYNLHCQLHYNLKSTSPFWT